MAKVKKPARLTGERNTRKGVRSKTAPGRKTTSPARKKAAPARKSMATKQKKQATPSARKRVVTKTLAKKVVVKKRVPVMKPAPVAHVAIKELDPQAKCGPDTSVQFLYRVDETVEGKRTPHLVFYDHHGWYCEHGRTCPAVGHAKKHNGQFAQAS